MVRTFVVENKHSFHRGQVIKRLDQTPSPLASDYLKIIKLLSYHNHIAEFQVKPVKRPSDPNNLVGWYR